MPLLNTLFNGEHKPIAFEERALHYGDGIFETMLMHNGKIALWDAHWQRLQNSCRQLGLNIVSEAQVQSEIMQLVDAHLQQNYLLIKLIVSRGAEGRGLVVPQSLNASRIFLVYDYKLEKKPPLHLGVCSTPLYENKQLAGMKHLNRIPYILAAQELAPNQEEGILLNTKAEMIECIAHNLFFVKDNTLYTAPIVNCGVAGVMRQQLLNLAKQLGLAVNINALQVQQLKEIDDCFISNALVGVQSVVQIGEHYFKPSSIFKRLQEQI